MTKRRDLAVGNPGGSPEATRRSFNKRFLARSGEGLAAAWSRGVQAGSAGEPGCARGMLQLHLTRHQHRADLQSAFVGRQGGTKPGGTRWYDGRQLRRQRKLYRPFRQIQRTQAPANPATITAFFMSAIAMTTPQRIPLRNLATDSHVCNDTPSGEQSSEVPMPKLAHSVLFFALATTAATAQTRLGRCKQLPAHRSLQS
jgi:hypothetical protein